jgi:hypothetical protein
MERGRDAASIEQQDRLAPVLSDTTERIEERRGQRIAGFTPQVDDADGRQ